MNFRVAELARRLKAALAQEKEVSYQIDVGGELLEQVAPAIEDEQDPEGVRHKEAA